MRNEIKSSFFTFGNIIELKNIDVNVSKQKGFLETVSVEQKVALTSLCGIKWWKSTISDINLSDLVV